MNTCKLFIAFVVLAALSCRKNDDNVLRHTKTMEGPHEWTGTLFGSNGDSYPYTMNWPIGYINDTTLRFWSIAFDTVTYHYLTSNAVGQTLYFTAKNQKISGFSYDTLIYYYAQNVIYYHGYSVYKGFTNYYDLHTP